MKHKNLIDEDGNFIEYDEVSEWVSLVFIALLAIVFTILALAGGN